MTSVDPFDHQQPLLFRMLIRVGRPFGLRWIGGRKLAVISQMERSHSLKGPGFFWIRPFFQRVKLVVSTAPERTSILIPNIITKYALHFEIKAVLEYRFNPRSLPGKAGVGAARRSPEPKDRQVLVEDHAQRALQEVLPNYLVVSL